MLNFSLNAGEERQLCCAGASLFDIYIFIRYALQKFVTMFEMHRKQYPLITQLLHQPLHIYKIYKIYTLKH